MVLVDGLCSIDVDIAHGATASEDHAKGLEVGGDIASLLVSCVIMANGVGGIATGVGN